ncbi:MAG TPA: hypothetical protein VM915_04795 [Verrucomicrobiae bacterium]|nr:hypothetical protein [Verrucomicrobiae bacterium]
MKTTAITLALLAATLAGCASPLSPERIGSTPTEELCKGYYYAWPRTQPRAVAAKDELIRRGETKCITDAEAYKGGQS